ncbi:MAG: 6,7-dimethyl-8-ribityllumazine synthase [Kiritimatiellia bacterium]|jgi:6,7-dimethyl-8-ribityllumazine synthase|nr:6,7-dimethyl-8-ribityllumazine synthase [Kiritimatiellia bacterium]
MNCKETSGQLNAQGLRFGLVVSRHNDFFTGQLLKGALDCLARHGADEKDIQIVWVPGAYEQPLVLQKIARSGTCDALVALGTVIQGATPHAGLINAQVARALVQISLESGLPVVDGIVAADNLDQAIERCGSKAGNRGWSAAQTAIEMAALMKALG